MNVYEPPAAVAASGGGIEIEIDTSERDYMIFQQTSELLESFPGEYVGDEITKIRVKITAGPHDFKILLVLDDFPNSLHVELPRDLEKGIGSFNSLETAVNWDPFSSILIDVFNEIKSKAEESFGEEVEVPSDLYEDIANRFDVEDSGKEMKVNMYSVIGEQHFVIIKKKRDNEYPKVVLDPILQSEDKVLDWLKSYKKKEMSLNVFLDFIEKFLLGQ
jgi:hypothetical protein